MSTVVELTTDECVALLAAGVIGRIGSTVDGKPFVLPVNYRWLSRGERHQIALRTRPSNVIDRSGELVAFEIDGIDHVSRRGWSVLVRGLMYHLGETPAEHEILDSGPWVDEDRNAWLVIIVHEITGRRIEGTEPEWAFHPSGYR